MIPEVFYRARIYGKCQKIHDHAFKLDELIEEIGVATVNTQTEGPDPFVPALLEITGDGCRLRYTLPKLVYANFTSIILRAFEQRDSGSLTSPVDRYIHLYPHAED